MSLHKKKQNEPASWPLREWMVRTFTGKHRNTLENSKLNCSGKSMFGMILLEPIFEPWLVVLIKRVTSSTKKDPKNSSALLLSTWCPYSHLWRSVTSPTFEDSKGRVSCFFTEPKRSRRSHWLAELPGFLKGSSKRGPIFLGGGDDEILEAFLPKNMKFGLVLGWPPVIFRWEKAWRKPFLASWKLKPNPTKRPWKETYII